MKERKSNFELLRIVAMFCIVLGHSMTHGTLLNMSSDLSLIQFITFRFLAYSGKIGVYLFILISGYFMIYSTINVKKVIKLWLSVFFWSVFLTIFVGNIVSHPSCKEFALSFFPIISNRYWFVSTYVFLYFLIPIINKALLALNVRLEIFLIFLGIMIIFPSSYLYGSNVNSWLLSFCFTYSFGAIIRKRQLLKDKRIRMVGIAILLLGLVCNFINTIVITLIRNSSLNLNKLSSFLQQETLFCLFVAIGLFILLGLKTIPYNRFINAIASTTFGIYLIHDNNFVGQLLWIKLFHMDKINYSLLQSFAYILICVAIIFIMCSVLEMIRKRFFNGFENKVAMYTEKKITGFILQIKKYINKC